MNNFTEADLRNIANLCHDFSAITDIVAKIIPGYRTTPLKLTLLDIAFKAEFLADQEAKKLIAPVVK